MVRSRPPAEGNSEGRPPPPNPAMPYREDCWSEGATSALIDAWGDRYLELNRGNLRQQHWQEVADAVNSRPTVVKRPPRTDVQCKNRIDTIKKKFKAEKARIQAEGGGSDSQWPFYSRLETLIGSVPPPLPSSSSGKKKKKKKQKVMTISPPSSPPLMLQGPLAVPNSRKRPLASLMPDSSLRWGNYSAAAAAAAAAREDEPDSESSGLGGYQRKEVKQAKTGVKNGVFVRGVEEADGVKELAKAIIRFGEIYERVEIAKQRQMIEMEKQRMEFSKELEFKKMQMFIDSQVQLRRIKRANQTSGDGVFWLSEDFVDVRNLINEASRYVVVGYSHTHKILCGCGTI